MSNSGWLGAGSITNYLETGKREEKFYSPLTDDAKKYQMEKQRQTRKHTVHLIYGDGIGCKPCALDKKEK